jgi:uncharacterized protein (TIGR03084 family)
MSTLLATVLADLAAEGDGLEALVADLPAAAWRTPTPAPGWDVATQIAHLAWTDEAAHAAATDRMRWDALLRQARDDPEHAADTAARAGAQATPDELLDRWRGARAQLAETLRDRPPGHRIPWYAGPMSATSMATARIMETWAHGLDVRQALGVAPEASDRIRHVAHLGIWARDYAFSLHGLDAPDDLFRVELTAPSGGLWTWGPEDATQRVTGTAYDFCLLATQRVHRGDTALVAVGREADRWLDIAQAFAGPPGGGRESRRG